MFTQTQPSPPDRLSSGQILADRLGRRIGYIRVSVTDRCDMRCQYCMAERMTFLPRKEILTLEQVYAMTCAFMDLGVRKVRVTGGEPLVRANVMRLFRDLGRHLDSGDLDEVTLTTNGGQLARHAADLKACGVRRINVSLDTLDPDRFQALTRIGRLSDVLAGLDAADRAGLKVKINTVALKGINDAHLFDMMAWAHGRGYDWTMIEVMPLGEVTWDREGHFLDLAEVEAELRRAYTITDLPDSTGGPARYLRVAETGGRVGLITPLSHGFCATCNRVRVTATGKLYMCLGQNDHIDLAPALRSGGGSEAVRAAILDAVALKPPGHEFSTAPRRNGGTVSRHMSITGG